MSKHGVARNISARSGRSSPSQGWFQHLGSRITALRKRHALSQRELAERARVDVSTVSRLESGRLNPTITTLLEIATVLEVSVDELAGRDPGAFAWSAVSTPEERQPATQADRLTALEEEVRRLRGMLDELPKLARQVSLLAATLAAAKGASPSRRKQPRKT